VVEMINQKPIEEFLTINQVARILQVDYDTIRKFLDSEMIPVDKWVKVGKQIRIKASALKEL